MSTCHVFLVASVGETQSVEIAAIRSLSIPVCVAVEPHTTRLVEFVHAQAAFAGDAGRVIGEDGNLLLTDDGKYTLFEKSDPTHRFRLRCRGGSTVFLIASI